MEADPSKIDPHRSLTKEELAEIEELRLIYGCTSRRNCCPYAGKRECGWMTQVRFDDDDDELHEYPAKPGMPVRKLRWL